MHSKFIKFVVLFGVFLVTDVALAGFDKCEGEIRDNSVFVGSWTLESTRPSRTSGSKFTDELWQFNADGVFKLTAQDNRASSTITSTSTFIIKDDILKIARVGRAGKFYDYKLCEKDDTTMTLFGGLEGFHFFRKN